MITIRDVIVEQKRRHQQQLLKVQRQRRLWLLLFSLLLLAGCGLGRPDSGPTPLPTMIGSETAEPTAVAATASATAGATTGATATVALPTATGTPDPVTTTPPTTATAVPTLQPATATPVVVLPAEAPYIMALTDLNLHSGPGLDYGVVGWMTHGQIARVTGGSSDGGWWQLDCPSTNVSICWVTAGSQYTKPQPDAARIQFAPGATSETIVASMSGQSQVHYVLQAGAGQTMLVRVTSPGDSVLFHLQGLRDGQIYKHMLSGETEWQGTLPQTQDYLLALNSTGDMAAYTIYLSITDQPPVATPTSQPVPAGPLSPVVDAQTGYLLGGTQYGVWIDAQEYASYLQDTERHYSLYTMAGRQGTVSGSPPLTPSGVCSQPLVALDPPAGLDGAIALVARWDAAPRLPQPQPLDLAGFQETVAALLQEQGLTQPQVSINRLLSIDLEGDGRDEYLVSASRLSGGVGTPEVAAGDYSLFMLQKTVGDVTTNVPLALDVYLEAEQFAYPFHYDLLGVLDVSGDGRLEIFVEAERYEGRLVTAYEITPAGLQRVLQGGCVQ